MKKIAIKLLRALFIGALFAVPVGKILIEFVPNGVAILGATVVAILFWDSGIFGYDQGKAKELPTESAG